MLRALTFLLFLSWMVSDTEAARPDAWLDQQIDSIVDLYKHLHRNPELSFQEVESARRVAEELRKTGVEVTEGVGGHGIVGVLRNGEGPTVLVRTDLDALPVVEETGLPYASKVQVEDEEGNNVGVMHACGHDIHMANLVGTARWLAAHKDRWAGTVVFVGQPAEEKVAGARAMLADGLYERFPRPDFALALHVAHDLPTGSIGYCSGAAMASSTSVDLLLRGKGGHGAAPHTTVDLIVLAAALIIDMQTIVSREISPIEPAGLTVGSIQGGSKHNIIPSEVRLQLTLRAYKPEVRDQLIEGIERRALALAEAHKAPAPSLKVSEGTPPTINTSELVDRILPVFVRELGETAVLESDPTMGAEDFGLYGLEGEIPTFMFRLGTIPPDRMANGEPLPSLHSSLYYPDPEPSLRTGIKAMSAAVLELLPASR